MATKNSVSNDFLSIIGDSIKVFDCRLSGVVNVYINHTRDSTENRCKHENNVNDTTKVLKCCVLVERDCEFIEHHYDTPPWDITATYRLHIFQMYQP